MRIIIGILAAIGLICVIGTAAFIGIIIHEDRQDKKRRNRK